jgi:hypothetical protein
MQARLLQDVLAVGTGEGQQDRGADLGLVDVVAAHLGRGRGHARGQQVELEHVGGQRERHQEEAAQAGDEAADGAELAVVARDDPQRLVGVAAGVLERVGGDLVSRVERPLPVDADIEQPLDQPGRGP